MCLFVNRRGMGQQSRRKDPPPLTGMRHHRHSFDPESCRSPPVLTLADNEKEKSLSCDFGRSNNYFKHQDGQSVLTSKRSLSSGSGERPMLVSCHPPVLCRSERSWRLARTRKEDALRITRQLLTCHKRGGSRADPHLFILPFFFLHMLLVFGALAPDTGCQRLLCRHCATQKRAFPGGWYHAVCIIDVDDTCRRRLGRPAFKSNVGKVSFRRLRRCCRPRGGAERLTICPMPHVTQCRRVCLFC